jgi:hypothetical protein
MASPHSLAQAARARNFPTLALELVLIVAGVLIALGVDGWIQDRDEQRLERESLELILADLELLDEQLEEFLAYQESLQRMAATAHRALTASPSIPRADTVAAAFLALSSRRTLRLPRSAYEELVTTGSLRLIRDTGLRRELVRFYQTLSREEAIIDKNNAAFNDGLGVEFFIGEGMVRYIPPPGGLLVDSVIGPVGERTLQSLDGRGDPFGGRIWTLTRQDPEWEQAVSITLFLLRTAVGAELLGQSMAREAEDLRAAIRAALP